MILTVCEDILNLLVSEGVQKTKLKTIYSSSDPERFNPETVKSNIREELGIRDDEVVITKIAHYSPWKGYDCFFEAVKLLLAQRSPNVKFIIGGKL